MLVQFSCFTGHDLIVVSSHPTTTVNYIFGVALGCTIIRHDTIYDCVHKVKALLPVPTVVAIWFNYLVPVVEHFNREFSLIQKASIRSLIPSAD